MSDNRNAGFALSYAKDLMSNMIHTDVEAATKETIKMADEFLKWLDQPSMDDRIRSALFKAKIKSCDPLTRVEVIDIWSKSNGIESDFIKRITDAISDAVAASN